MNIRQANQAMIRATKGGEDAMAAAIGITPASLHNRLYQVKGQTFTLEQELAMQSVSGTTHFAQAVAEISGGVFVKLPEIDHLDNTELLNMFTAAMADVGKLSTELTEASADGEIDDKERARIKATLRHMQTQFEGLVAAYTTLFSRHEGKVAKLKAVK